MVRLADPRISLLFDCFSGRRSGWSRHSHWKSLEVLWQQNGVEESLGEVLSQHDHGISRKKRCWKEHDMVDHHRLDPTIDGNCLHRWLWYPHGHHLDPETIGFRATIQHSIRSAHSERTSRILLSVGYHRRYCSRANDRSLIDWKVHQKNWSIVKQRKCSSIWISNGKRTITRLNYQGEWRGNCPLPLLSVETPRRWSSMSQQPVRSNFCKRCLRIDLLSFVPRCGSICSSSDLGSDSEIQTRSNDRSIYASLGRSRSSQWSSRDHLFGRITMRGHDDVSQTKVRRRLQLNYRIDCSKDSLWSLLLIISLF